MSGAAALKRELEDRSAGLVDYELFFRNMGFGFTLRQVLDRQLQARKTIRVCDLGCGDARALRDLTQVYGKRIYTIGVDAHQTPFAHTNCDEFHVQEIPHEALPSGCDNILSFRALHEIGNSEKVLRRVQTALAPNGEAFLSIRCQEWLENRAKNLGNMRNEDILFLLDILEKNRFGGLLVNGNPVPVVMAGKLKNRVTGEPHPGVQAYIAGINLWLQNQKK